MLIFKKFPKTYADVAELADALVLGTSVNDVGVQVPSSAPKRVKIKFHLFFFFFFKLILCQKSPSLLSQDFKMEEKLNMENEKIKYLIDIINDMDIKDAEGVT